MNLQEYNTAKLYMDLAEPHVRRAGGAPKDATIWTGWTGPTKLKSKGITIPMYALHLDVSRLNPAKVSRDLDMIHNIETALQSKWQVSVINSVGLSLLIHPVFEIDLLEAIDGECVLLVGKRRSGKTTIYQHHVAKFDGEVVIIDAKKTKPGKWVNGRVVGSGGDYAAIDAELDRLLQLMHHRDESSGKLLVVMDDIPMINVFLPTAMRRALQIFAFGGEAGMDVVLITQNDEVEAMNMAGLGKYRSQFLRVDIDKVGDRRRVTVDYGDGPRPANHPGPFGVSDDEEVPVILEEPQKRLVQYAWHMEPKRSFALQSKMFRIVKEHPSLGWSEWKIRKQAEAWEAEGLLTSESTDSNGQKVPRMVTSRLARAADVHVRGGG